jgi:hypothetical protein
MPGQEAWFRDENLHKMGLNFLVCDSRLHLKECFCANIEGFKEVAGPLFSTLEQAMIGNEKIESFIACVETSPKYTHLENTFIWKTGKWIKER